MSVEAIKKALEGVTPGPWGYVASNENHGPYVCNDWGAGDICDGYVMSNPDSLSVRNGGNSRPINHQHDEADANMRYIAAVNPAAVSELLSTLESLQRENEALKRDRYDLAYAITGGEDAPGLLDTVPTTELVEIARDTHRSHSADIDRAIAAEAEVIRLRDALHKIESGYGANDICARIARDALASTGGEHHAE